MNLKPHMASVKPTPSRGAQHGVEGARGESAQHGAVGDRGARFQPRAHVKIILRVAGDAVVNFLEVSQVGCQVDIHIADEIGIRLPPCLFERQAEAALADAQIGDAIVARGQGLTDLASAIGRSIIGNAERVDGQTFGLAKGECLLDGGSELILLVQNGKGDMDLRRVHHLGPAFGATRVHPPPSRVQH